MMKNVQRKKKSPYARKDLYCFNTYREEPLYEAPTDLASIRSFIEEEAEMEGDEFNASDYVVLAPVYKAVERGRKIEIDFEDINDE